MEQIQVNAIIKKGDPTRTLTIRNQFVLEMNRRFLWLKKRIIFAITTQDVFGLLPRTNPFIQQDLVPRQFQFLNDPEKVAAFIIWLEEQIRLGIFELTTLNPQAVIGGDWWADAYISKGYERGLRSATSLLGGVVASTVVLPMFEDLIRFPIHIDRLGLLYTRTFEELRGVTSAMSQQIARTLTDGMARGHSPALIARNLVNRVDAIGLTRSRVLARTEIIRAHAEATLNNFESFGVYDVELDVEFTTAGFGVCPVCQKIRDNKPIFTIAEARGVIPVHPNCRCAWLPYDREAKQILGESYD